MDNTPAPNAPNWPRTRRITFALLALWAGLILLVAVFAQELTGWQVLGMPFPFYFFSQGALLLFLALVAGNTWLMNRLERHKTANKPTLPR